MALKNNSSEPVRLSVTRVISYVFSVVRYFQSIVRRKVAKSTEYRRSDRIHAVYERVTRVAVRFKKIKTSVQRRSDCRPYNVRSVRLLKSDRIYRVMRSTGYGVVDGGRRVLSERVNFLFCSKMS